MLHCVLQAFLSSTGDAELTDLAKRLAQLLEAGK